MAVTNLEESLRNIDERMAITDGLTHILLAYERTQIQSLDIMVRVLESLLRIEDRLQEEKT